MCSGVIDHPAHGSLERDERHRPPWRFGGAGQRGTRSIAAPAPPRRAAAVRASRLAVRSRAAAAAVTSAAKGCQANSAARVEATRRAAAAATHTHTHTHTHTRAERPTVPERAGIEDLREKREAVNTAILKEEEEKAKIQKDLSILTDRLSKINEALARRVMARNEYDKTIQETEAAYMKILESSQTLLHVLKRETVNLTKKKQYSS